jgi:uncharacterized protein DUF998
MSVKIGSHSSNEAILKITDPANSLTAPSQVAGRVSFAASVATLVFLAALHLLSPEFDPSWRMVSEYALGNYGWVLSLMFIAWAVSSWALFCAVWSHVRTRAGKIGLGFLVAAGVGEAMASIFDISHPLHGVAGVIGILSLPIAAILMSVSLSRAEAWSVARKALLWTANLTWISVVLMAASFILLIVTFTQAGGEMASQVTSLPSGVIALVGWTNRFLIIAYCIWVMIVARHAVMMKSRPS